MKRSKAFLAGAQAADPLLDHGDGAPHLVTMYYALIEDDLAFWTYGKAQKIVNPCRRDPRITCLLGGPRLRQAPRSHRLRRGRADRRPRPRARVRPTGRAPPGGVRRGTSRRCGPFLEQQALKQCGARVHAKRTASLGPREDVAAGEGS